MVLSLLAAFAVKAQDFPKDFGPPLKRWFVFLNTGPNRVAMSSEESAAGMKGHLGNFGEQYKLGKLDLAGPLGGNGFIRGIVAVRAADERGVKALFASDPFIQSDRLRLEMYAMDGPFDRILHPEGEPGMTTMTLMIVKKGLKWTMSRRMPKSISEWDRDGKLGFWAKFGLKDSDKLGIVYFWDKDVKKVAAWAHLDPYIASQELAYEVHPQYIGKMFKNQPPDSKPLP